MSRKSKSNRAETEPKSSNGSVPIRTRALRALVIRLLGILVLIALFLGAIVLVGQYARQAIQKTDRYVIPFSEIECVPPPGQERSEFLAEVQYLSGSPEQIKLLDGDLAPQLMDAFAVHPWVRSVDDVIVAAPRHVAVRLTYRLPVLIVKNDAASPWVLDGEGRILPATAKTDALPVLQTKLQPKEPVGTVWRDRAIEAAARTAAVLRPHQDVLRLQRMQMANGVMDLLTAAGSRVRWSGLEKVAEEVPDAQKLERLLQYCHEHGSLDQPDGPLEHDVRPRVGVIARPIKP
jgi:hypothetical protein